MSDTSESLRRKLESAGKLHSVVRAMKALAASNIGQYERSVLALRDYSRTVELALGVCLREAAAKSDSVHWENPPPPKCITAIVFGSDQGLIGQFNDLVSDYATDFLNHLNAKPRVWAVGERVQLRLKDAGLSLRGLFSVPNSVESVTPLVGEILVKCEAEIEGSEFYLFYNRAEPGAQYSPIHKRLLPLDEKWRRARTEVHWPTKNLPEVLSTSTLPALIREFLFISLFRGCAESLAAENASRLSAMQRADKNINDLLEDLTGTFNHLRQSRIDEELFDVVSGFETLSRRRPL